eukprot:1284257-Rhodomonas_salina.1
MGYASLLNSAFGTDVWLVWLCCTGGEASRASDALGMPLRTHYAVFGCHIGCAPTPCPVLTQVLSLRNVRYWHSVCPYAMFSTVATGALSTEMGSGATRRAESAGRQQAKWDLYAAASR